MSIYQSTIARNTGTGLTIAQGTADLYGSIIANNTANCGTSLRDRRRRQPRQQRHLRVRGANSNKDPGLDTLLTDQGG